MFPDSAPLVAALAEAERSQIRTIAEAAVAVPGVARLDIGQPDLPVPQAVLSATSQATLEGKSGYTPTAGIPELRERLAERTGERTASAVSADQVFVTTGGTNAMALSLTATSGPGDTLLVPELRWPNLRSMARTLRCHLKTYALDPVTSLPDPDALLKSARESRARAVILNSPGNPTGAVIPAGDLERIVCDLRRLGCWVISDEVYEDLDYDAPAAAARSFASTGVISVHSFSKSYSMTGFRLGHVWAQPEVVEALARIQEGVVTCSSSIAQQAGLAALELGDTFLEGRRREYRRRHELADGLLTRAGLAWNHPQGAFYSLVDLDAGDALDGLSFAQQLMHQHRVAVVPGSAFGDAPTGRIRLSLAADDATLKRGIAALASANRSPS